MEYSNLGRQDFDDTLAMNAEYVVLPAREQMSLLFVGACVLLPFGLFVLAAAVVKKYIKERARGNY